MPPDEEELFCRIVTENNLLTPEQLARCKELRADQTGKPKPLVIICIEQGFIDDKKLEKILELERAYLDDATDAGRDLLFGEICVARGFCNPTQLEAALADQRDRGKKRPRIGKILIEAGALTAAQVAEVLNVQGKRVGECTACGSRFNIARYRVGKIYNCRRCGGELEILEEVSSGDGGGGLGSSPSAVSVERESLVGSLIATAQQAGALVGQTVDGYQVVELIGEGGMAEVYKAYSPEQRRTRAIKVVKEDAPQARFLREIESSSRLRHPNIISIFEHGFHGNRAYYFMELVPGDTLLEWMRRVPIPFDDGLEILRQIAEALAHAHEQGIVHRDVKPSNILVDRSGSRLVAKLTDFGIAKSYQDTGLTGTGQIVGTMKYLSPEHIQGEELDGRADIFSLGILCHELFAGREPFRVDSKVGYLFTNIQETAPKLSQVKPGLPAALDKIVDKMLEKDRPKRYQADVLAEDVGILREHLLSGAPLKSENRDSVFAGGTGLMQGLTSFFRRKTTSVFRGLGSTAPPAPSSVDDREDRRSTDRRARTSGRRGKSVAPPPPAAAPQVDSDPELTAELEAGLARVQDLERDGKLGQARDQLRGLIAAAGSENPLRKKAVDLLGRIERHLVQPTGAPDLGGGKDLTQALLVDSQMLVKMGRKDPLALAQQNLVLLKTFVDNLRGVAEYDRDIGQISKLLGELDENKLSDEGAEEMAASLLQLSNWLVARDRADDARRWLWTIRERFDEADAAEQALKLLVELEAGDSMVLVVAGPLTIETELRGAPERLGHYLIDRTPVTNAEYQVFVEETGYPAPPYWRDGRHPPELGDHPVTHVNYFDAAAYAGWAGKRLPTEFEWEKAARGEQPQPYPWGQVYEEARANTRAANWGETTPVQHHADGASPYGCLDMCGNVWEWTESWLNPREETERVIRGGSWFSFPEYATLDFRNHELPQARRGVIGFRCAKSLTRAADEDD